MKQENCCPNVGCKFFCQRQKNTINSVCTTRNRILILCSTSGQTKKSCFQHITMCFSLLFSFATFNQFEKHFIKTSILLGSRRCMFRFLREPNTISNVLLSELKLLIKLFFLIDIINNEGKDENSSLYDIQSERTHTWQFDAKKKLILQNVFLKHTCQAVAKNSISYGWLKGSLYLTVCCLLETYCGLPKFHGLWRTKKEKGFYP